MLEWIATLIKDPVLKIIEGKYQKELAFLQSTLDKRSYVSKARFDLEFNLLEDLTVKIYRLTDSYYKAIDCFVDVPNMIRVINKHIA